MPDFEITMTVARPAPEKGWLKSVIVQDTTQELAVPIGMAELFKWAQEETDHPIPPKAIEYWNEVRNGLNGPVHMMEIQTQMENWGITFGRQRFEAEPPPLPSRALPKPSRNGHAPVKPLSFNDMLAQQLGSLQERQKELTAERKRIQAEYEENHESIQQITTFLMIQKPAKKGRKAHGPSAEA